MKIVSRLEFEKWILEQPDNKRLDFNNNTKTTDCHCPMIDFGYDNLPPFTNCGSYYWFDHNLKQPETIAEFEKGMFFNDYGSAHETYGYLKRAVLTRRNSLSTKQS